MKKYPSLEKIKAAAKSTHALLKSQGNERKLSEIYERLSHCYGFKDWNTFCAILKSDREISEDLIDFS